MNIFKRSIAYLGLMVFMFGFISNPSISSAQTGDLFSGQEHSYSVIFRGNGEAVVYGKIDFTNTGEESIKKFSLEIPSVKPEELMFLQTVNPIQTPFECPGYPTVMQREFCPNIDYYGYAKPTFLTPEYKKLKFTSSGTVHEMELSQEVLAGQKGNIVFAYVASGYVEKALGVYKFKFETPKVASRIKSISVAVDVDSELILKGKRSEVNYATSGLSNMMADMPSGARADSFVSPEFSKVVSTIGSGGPVIKSAQNLSPNESLTVNGQYALSNLALNWMKIALGLVIAILIILGIIFLARKWRRSHPLASQPLQQGSDIQTNESFSLLHPIYTSIGFASAVIIYGSIFLVQLFMRTGMMYGNYQYGDTLMPLAVILIVGVIILALLILPPILVSSKYGWRAGISVVINTVLSIIVLLAIYIILNIIGAWPSARNYQPYNNYPYMME